jgi:hypothetical protein
MSAFTSGVVPRALLGMYATVPVMREVPVVSV